MFALFTTFMKILMLVAMGLLGVMSGSHAQDRIYRCGNEYTNNAAVARTRGCKALDGTNVTVIQGTRVQGAGSGSNKAAPPPSITRSPGQQVDPAQQRTRDSDARVILESELKRTESRQAELLREYNNGEPEKLGPETRNHQKYLDRVADLKASISRNESDLAGIRRELGRLSPSAAQ